jgi:transcriptional regulator with PAS, ATPase and Fis domain
MARVQYHIVRDGAVQLNDGGPWVPHYKAVIRDRPGRRYLRCLRIKREQQRLHEAVRLHGSQRKAAEALGISRDQLQRWLRRVA